MMKTKLVPRRIIGRNINQSIILVLLIIGISLFATLINPRFIRITNLINIFQQISVLGVIASGIGMLLISGEFDISVGSQVSLIGMILAMIIQKVGGLPEGSQPNGFNPLSIPLAVIVSCLVGIALGFINGMTVIKSRAASFIITLGFSSIYKGLALLLSGGASFMLFGKFETVGRGRIMNYIPIAILFFIGVVLISHVILSYSKYGRYLYAIGGNKKAAYVSGINTDRMTLIAYVMVGLLNAVAALILISRVGSALATTGDAYTLDALAAVVVGGVAITGGEGSALSIFLGVVLIGLIGNALVIMNVNPYLRDVVIGLIIITAVTISRVTGRRR
ncbi:MAG: ABC transporter permease [Candidatus Atribacteria bacterium]|nr:ABC transporter permease [Candidatus Atribacteria bacterium]